jgi:hypothetical protein
MHNIVQAYDREEWMMAMSTSTRLVLLAVLACGLAFFEGGAAQACEATGQPKITIKIEGNGAARALISEYSCAMMVRKTHCIVGVRLADAAPGDANIAIESLRFVRLVDRVPLSGFAPTPNRLTTTAWANVMDGTWYGFSAVFGAETKDRGGLAIEIAFTYNSALNEQQLLKAFDRGHVGLAEGSAQGGIAHGHMLEVMQIQGASLARG